MKKSVIKILALLIAALSVFAFSACSKNNRIATEIKTGLDYEIKTNEDGVKYAVINGFRLSDSDQKKVSDGIYTGLELKEDCVSGRKLSVSTVKDEDGTEVAVTEIAANAFANQLLFTEVEISSKVEKIGAGAFAGCSNLKSLKVPFVGGCANGVNDQKVIGYLFGTTYAEGCVSITQSYNSSGSKAFYIPSSLEKVTVTGDVALLEYAFNGTQIKEVVFEGKLERIGAMAFANMQKMSVFVLPATVTEIGKNAFSASSLLYRVDMSGNTVLKSIGDEAFADCTMLGRGLEANRVALPASVEVIGDGAFKNCTSMVKIDLSNTAISAIPDYCFYGCEKLEECKYADAVTAPKNAFWGTKLAENA